MSDSLTETLHQQLYEIYEDSKVSPSEVISLRKSVEEAEEAFLNLE